MEKSDVRSSRNRDQCYKWLQTLCGLRLVGKSGLIRREKRRLRERERERERELQQQLLNTLWTEVMIYWKVVYKRETERV